MTATAQTLRPPSRTLMFLEGRAIHEFGAFLGALPLLSLAPRGDGHPVLVLPGLVASDASTRALRSFLTTKGYAVSGWRQGRNYGLRDGVQHAMVDLVEELSDKQQEIASAVDAQTRSTNEISANVARAAERATSIADFVAANRR